MMLLSSIFIASTAGMGRGVFTSENIEEGTIIEISPVIVMSNEERKLLDQTSLHDYIFEWGEKKDHPIAIGCCMAMGYVPVYNHSYHSNCEYEMDFDKAVIRIKTVRFIKAGEELFINYNGDWNEILSGRVFHLRDMFLYGYSGNKDHLAGYPLLQLHHQH
jgi:uncharacterized protein